jgi:hypothetical protein
VPDDDDDGLDVEDDDDDEELDEDMHGLPQRVAYGLWRGGSRSLGPMLLVANKAMRAVATAAHVQFTRRETSSAQDVLHCHPAPSIVSRSRAETKRSCEAGFPVE